MPSGEALHQSRDMWLVGLLKSGGIDEHAVCPAAFAHEQLVVVGARGPLLDRRSCRRRAARGWWRRCRRTAADALQAARRGWAGRRGWRGCGRSGPSGRAASRDPWRSPSSDRDRSGSRRNRCRDHLDAGDRRGGTGWWAGGGGGAPRRRTGAIAAGDARCPERLGERRQAKALLLRMPSVNTLLTSFL